MIIIGLIIIHILFTSVKELFLSEIIVIPIKLETVYLL